MKKTLFSIILALLLLFALFAKQPSDDLSDVNAQLVSYIAQNPEAAEVFCLDDGAVET